MHIQWIIHTHGQPLLAVQGFLSALWEQAGLDATLVAAGGDQPSPGAARLIEHAGLLGEVDPFGPLMTGNLARDIPRLIQEHPGVRLGVLLRPCELRALVEVAKRLPLKRENLLIIGVDCMGSLPEIDYEWRAELVNSFDMLTSDLIQFARQGGILDYRRRMACQMCAAPGAQLADINIHILGLPVRHLFLVQALDVKTAQRLHLEQITGGEASSELVAQHERTLAQLAGRRQRTLERAVKNLALDLPHDLETLVAQLERCGECQDCMLACPICAADFPQRAEDGHYPLQAMARWLVSCAGCGMCEQACSSQLPLATIFSLIRRQLDEELGYAPGADWDTPLPI
jgi:formate dehydrogenase subunit beta